MDVAWYILLILVLLAGIFLNILTLPGIWVMVLGALLYGWITHWQYVGLWTLVTLTGIAVISEILENFAGGVGAKRVGGSPRAAKGALIGGIIGGLFLSIPLPIVGTIVGVCIGVFVGALVAEYSIHGRSSQSVAVGIGAASGRLVGIVVKIGISLVMLVITVIAAWPHAVRPAPTVPTPRVPSATAPATQR